MNIKMTIDPFVTKVRCYEGDRDPENLIDTTDLATLLFDLSEFETEGLQRIADELTTKGIARDDRFTYEIA